MRAPTLLSPLLLMVATAAVAAAVAACDPFNPELGDTPFRCGTSTPVCPEGYDCVVSQSNPADRICTRLEGEETADAADGNNCGDDNDSEPNENVADPTTTPIPDFQSEFTVQGYAICPAGDVDTYRFRISLAEQNVTLDLMYNAAQGELAMDLLNADGDSIGSAMPVGGDSDSLQVLVRNLPTGTYFAQVRGGTLVRNSYNMTIALTGP